MGYPENELKEAAGPPVILINLTPLKSKEFRIITISLVVSLLLTLAKFTAYFTTFSIAILSDALESIINVMAGIFACYSIYLASKPRDLNHPYGHGKVEFFSIGFEGGMILIAGCLILYKAIHSFMVPHPLQKLNGGILILAVTGIVNFILGFYLIRSGKKLPSITISGNGQHILTDAWSSLGLIAALALIRITGWHWLDPVASLILGTLIIIKGYKLMRHSISGLMDETDMQIIDRVVKVLSDHRHPAWIDVHNMRVQQYGQNYHIDCHITMPYYYSLEQVHNEIKQIEAIFNAQLTQGHVECFVHTDPCVPESCPLCMIMNCPVRSFPFEKEIPWTRDTVLPNKQHIGRLKQTETP